VGRIVKAIIAIAILIVIGLLGCRFVRLLPYLGACRDCTFAMVERTADTDHDGKVSGAEWRTACEEMGVSYDPGNPPSFANRPNLVQMVTYVDLHVAEVRKYEDGHPRPRPTPEQEDEWNEQFELRTKKALLEWMLQSLAGKHGLPSEAIGKDPEHEIPILLSLLKNADAEAAAQVLGHIGKPAVPQLLPLLGSPDEKLRRWACYAFETMGTEGIEAVPDLIRLLDTKEPLVFSNAADALREMGPAARSAVPILIPWLKSEEPYARISAARALGGIGPEAREAIPSLEAVRESRPKDEETYYRRALRRIQAQRKG
jgi:HEAT repeats